MNRSRCSLELTCMGPRNHLLDGVVILHGKWQFWGSSGQLISIVNHCCVVRCKRHHSILNNDPTCDAAFHQNSSDHLFRHGDASWLYIVMTVIKTRSLRHTRLANVRVRRIVERRPSVITTTDVVAVTINDVGRCPCARAATSQNLKNYCEKLLRTTIVVQIKQTVLRCVCACVGQ